MPDLESLLREKRVFKPPAEFARNANWTRGQAEGAARARRAEPAALLGDDGARERHLVQALEEGARLEAAVREVVRRRQAQRLLQLPRPASRGRARLAPQQGRDRLGGRAGRRAHAHLRPAPRRGVPVRQCALGARRREGRPRGALHADDPRAADRDARVRADRRAAQRGVRRVLRRGAARPDRGRRREARRHRRRRVPARRALSAQDRGRRGAERRARRRPRGGGAPHGRADADGDRARRLVARRRAR